MCSQLRRPSQKGTELKPCPIRHRLPTPAPPSSWPSPLTAPDTSREWDHTRVVSMRPSHFAWHAVLRVRRGVLRVGAPFPSWVTAPRACRPLPAPTRLPPGARAVAALGCRDYTAANAGARTPLRVPASRPFGSVPRSGTAGFSADSAFNSSEGAPAVFRGGRACHSESFDVRCWGRWGRSLVRDVGVTAG